MQTNSVKPTPVKCVVDGFERCPTGRSRDVGFLEYATPQKHEKRSAMSPGTSGVEPRRKQSFIVEFDCFSRRTTKITFGSRHPTVLRVPALAAFENSASTVYRQYIEKPVLFCDPPRDLRKSNFNCATRLCENTFGLALALLLVDPRRTTPPLKSVILPTLNHLPPTRMQAPTTPIANDAEQRYERS
jgi:hypothetical protein